VFIFEVNFLYKIQMMHFLSNNVTHSKQGNENISLFEHRKNHFLPEKNILCDILVKRITDYLENDTYLNIILILDSGSTVFPVFKKLCDNPILKNNRTIAQRLKIITNNLSGISSIVKYGNIGDTKSEKTIFQCRILAGNVQSGYDISLGLYTMDDLETAINEFLNGEKRKNKIISVTTGNYISIDDGILGTDITHINLKRKMIEVGNEVFVLCPLGKVLPYSCNHINKLIKNDRVYKVANWPTCNKLPNNKFWLISTYRNSGYFTQVESPNMMNYLRYTQKMLREKFGECVIDESFDPMEDINVKALVRLFGAKQTLWEYEFPDKNLQRSLPKLLDYKNEYKQI